MSAEMSLLTSMRKDIKVFGTSTKEFTMTAADPLTKGTTIAVGVDGKAYKAPNAADREGSFEVDMETFESEIGNSNLNRNSSKITMQNGTVEVILNHIDNKNSNVNYVGQQKMILSTISSLGSVVNLNLQTQAYIPSSNYANGMMNPRVYKLNETHFVAMYHYVYHTYSSSHTAYTYTKAFVYSVAGSGSLTLVSQATATHSNGMSASVGISHSYGVIMRISPYEFISGIHPQQTYGQKITINSTTYAITTSAHTFGHTRSSDHNGFTMYFDDGAGKTSAMWFIAPNSKWLVSSSGVLTQATPTADENLFMSSGVGSSYGTINSFVIKNTVFSFCQNPSNRKAIEYKADGTPTIYPITYDPTDQNYMKAVKNSLGSTGEIPYIQESDTSFLVCLPTFVTNNYVLDYGKSHSDGVVTSTDLVVIRIVKDVTNKVYIGSSVCRIPNAMQNFNDSIGAIASVNSGTYVFGQKFYASDNTNSTPKFNSALYEVNIYNKSAIPSTAVSAYVKEDVAANETVALVTSGVFADFDIPAGISTNGWVGIGNSKAIKGGI